MTRFLLAASLLALCVPAYCEEPPLGRLFFTPQQRSALDNARRNKIRAETLAAAERKKPEAPPKPVSRSVTVNGVVQRSDGESYVWINGRPVAGHSNTDDGIRVELSPDGRSSVVVREPERGRTMRLKVGERADLLTGRIDDTYARRPAPSPRAEKPAAAAAPSRRNRPAEDKEGERADEESSAGNTDPNAAPTEQ